MAANLTKPEHFARPLNKPLLLPPSVFEKPPVTPYQSVFEKPPVATYQNNNLEKAQKEIEALRVENERLKSMHSSKSAQSIAVPLSSQPDYADELIKRQAGEIAELKSELCKCRQLYEQDSKRWEKDMTMLQDNSEQELNRVDRQSRLREEDFEQNIDRLSRELQRTLEENDAQTTLMTEKFESTKNTLSLQIQELETELNSVKRDADKKTRELDSENRQKSLSLEENANLITQLKNYIGQTEQSHRPAQVWKTEKETVDNQLKIKEAENKKLLSHLELLEVRFRALNDILAIQEGELSKTKGEAKSKQHGLLITRWREKVFALLVQQKSSEIVYKNDLNKAKQQIQTLEDTVESHVAEQEMFKHSLTEKSAQLQMESQNRERLEQELAQTQEVAVCLDDRNKDQGNALESLVDFAQSLELKYQATMKTLEQKVVLLKALCQRVSFASSRMDLLKTQILRKTAMSTPVEADISRKSMSRSRADEDMSRDSEEHLYQELERVMRERDSLATQVRNDSSKWSQKMTETQSVYQTEIYTLKNTVEELESDIQQKTKTCARVTEELETLTEETQGYQDTIEQLQAELARHAKGVEGVLTDQRLKDDEIYSEKIDDIQRQLNESKREHAKTVVSLRQLERSRTREVERGKELLGATEEQLNYQVQQLQTRLMNVEKERNTMKATLRQEGLLSKLKSDRREPVWLHLDEGMADRDRRDSYPLKERDEEQSHDFEPDIVSARGPSEPVESVLQDLKSLSAAIFNEHLSDDDEDDDEDRGT